MTPWIPADAFWLRHKTYVQETFPVANEAQYFSFWFGPLTWHIWATSFHACTAVRWSVRAAHRSKVTKGCWAGEWLLLSVGKVMSWQRHCLMLSRPATDDKLQRSSRSCGHASTRSNHTNEAEQMWFLTFMRKGKTCCNYQYEPLKHQLLWTGKLR